MVVGVNSFETYQELVSAGLDINALVPLFGDFLIIAAQHDGLRWARSCLERGAEFDLHNG